jgi:hypothetical protein
MAEEGAVATTSWDGCRVRHCNTAREILAQEIVGDLSKAMNYMLAAIEPKVMMGLFKRCT